MNLEELDPSQDKNQNSTENQRLLQIEKQLEKLIQLLENGNQNKEKEILGLRGSLDHIVYKLNNLSSMGDRLKDLGDFKYLKTSIDSYNSRFNSYAKLTVKATVTFSIFIILLGFYTVWLFKIQRSIGKIEENNSVISKNQAVIGEVFKGDKKLWFDEKNRTIYFKDKKN